MDNSELKKLSRAIIGSIPIGQVVPSKKDYSRKKAKAIPKGDE